MEDFVVSSWVRVRCTENGRLHGEFMGEDQVHPKMEHFMVSSRVRVRCSPE